MPISPLPGCRSGAGLSAKDCNAHVCDVVVGVPSDLKRLLTTKPYYEASYVFVQKHGAEPISSFDDAGLKQARVGVQLVGNDAANTPPMDELARRGLVGNVHGYMVYGDWSKPNPLEPIVGAVATGDIDVAVVWGPAATYFARRAEVPLEVTPITTPTATRMSFDISMGVRKGDTCARKRDRYGARTPPGRYRRYPCRLWNCTEPDEALATREGLHTMIDLRTDYRPIGRDDAGSGPGCLRPPARQGRRAGAGSSREDASARPRRRRSRRRLNPSRKPSEQKGSSAAQDDPDIVPEITMVLFSPGGVPPTTTESAFGRKIMNDPDSIAAGKQLFSAMNCVGCHFHGGGGMGLALTWVRPSTMAPPSRTSRPASARAAPTACPRSATASPTSRSGSSQLTSCRSRSPRRQIPTPAHQAATLPPPAATDTLITLISRHVKTEGAVPGRTTSKLSPAGATGAKSPPNTRLSLICEFPRGTVVCDPHCSDVT